MENNNNIPENQNDVNFETFEEFTVVTAQNDKNRHRSYSGRRILQPA